MRDRTNLLQIGAAIFSGLLLAAAFPKWDQTYLLPFALVEPVIDWLFLRGAERQPATSLTGLRRLFLDGRAADTAWRQTWLALAVGVIAALIFGWWRKQK